jgi:hypothetical protein
VAALESEPHDDAAGPAPRTNDQQAHDGPFAKSDKKRMALARRTHHDTV